MMKKRFNITGTCNPNLHYMMDNSKKLEAIMELIEYGDYFTINRPRQYGKTTSLFLIKKELAKTTDYLPIQLNFQGVDSYWLNSDNLFAQMFLLHFTKDLKKRHPQLLNLVEGVKIERVEDLSDWISEFVERVDKKVVLLIDEVDASSNYGAFLSFLGMLRSKFLAREEEATFHSVVLAGVHDIKSLKYKLRNPNDAQTNSPWNIAVDFEVRMSFNTEEIAPMLMQYSEAENVKMDFEAISERLYYHTSGYPFLISKLCKNIAEKVLPKKENKTVWTLEDVEASVQLLLKENNTNFDSLIKNLENNQDLYKLVYTVLVEGAIIPFNSDVSLMKLGAMYGIFKEDENGRLKIHNRVYEQRIYNYMAGRKMEENIVNGKRLLGDQFSDDHGGLDLEAVLLKFQTFMKENYSKKNNRYIEREWRLLFLSFLKPIINGKGHDFKEVETSEEKRLDIVVTYLQYKYILELKRWGGPKAHGKGLTQLANYLDIHSVEKGYLLIFDTRQKPTFEAKTIQHQGKEIFAVWV